MFIKSKLMAIKREQEAQTKMFEFASHQLSLDDEAYGTGHQVPNLYW